MPGQEDAYFARRRRDFPMSGFRQPIRRCLRHLRNALETVPADFGEHPAGDGILGWLPFSFRHAIDDGLIGGNHRLLEMLIGGSWQAPVLVAVLGFLRDRLYARLAARTRSQNASCLATLRAGIWTGCQPSQKLLPSTVQIR
jgi:hypothetical protein